MNNEDSIDNSLPTNDAGRTRYSPPSNALDSPPFVTTDPPASESGDLAATAMPTMATLAAGLRDETYRAGNFRAGDRLGKYQIIKPLGRGGFGSIYEAEHVYIKHRVALKTISQGYAKTEIAERFLREARVIAALRGRGVLNVYDVDMWEGQPYIALELIAGGNLSENLRVVSRFSINRALDLMEEMAHVLVRHQAMSIVHRDIKPSNICIRSNGQFCLLDYGLVGIAGDKTVDSETRAQMDFRDVTVEGAICGTPRYMSPEQWQSPQVSHQSDLFSLGVTAWECLCGRLARKSTSSHEEMKAEAMKPIPSAREWREDMPDALETILFGLLSIDRAKRYSSAGELLKDIEGYRYHGRKVQGPIEGAVFVAIPFAYKFEGVFEAIAIACSRRRLQANRMDRLVFVQDIWNQMVHEIQRSGIVVADFTWETWRQRANPNVVTEAAHARAIGKPLILISQNSAESLPFDWRHMPVIRYTNNKSGLAELTARISERLRDLWQGTT